MILLALWWDKATIMRCRGFILHLKNSCGWDNFNLGGDVALLSELIVYYV